MRGFIATLAGLILALAIPVGVISTALWLTVPRIEFYETALQRANAYERIIQLADEQVSQLYTRSDATGEEKMSFPQILPSQLFSTAWLETQVHILLSSLLPLLTVPGTEMEDVKGVISLREPKEKAEPLINQFIAEQIPAEFSSMVDENGQTPAMVFQEIITGVVDEVKIRDVIIESIRGKNIIQVIAPELTSGNENVEDQVNSETAPADGKYDAEQMINRQFAIVQTNVQALQLIMLVSWIISFVFIAVPLLVLRGWKSKLRGAGWTIVIPALGVTALGGGGLIGTGAIKGFLLPMAELPGGWSALTLDIVQHLVKQITLPITWMGLPLVGLTIMFFIGSVLIRRPKST